MYPKDFKFLHINGLFYYKLEDKPCSWWMAMGSTYLVKKVDEKGQIYHDIHPESEKPLYKNGELNRLGFRVPDEQISNYFHLTLPQP